MHPSMPCACVYVALFARRLTYNHYTPKQCSKNTCTRQWPGTIKSNVTLLSKAITQTIAVLSSVQKEGKYSQNVHSKHGPKQDLKVWVCVNGKKKGV